MTFTNPCPVCGWYTELYFGQLQLCGHQERGKSLSESIKDISHLAHAGVLWHKPIKFGEALPEVEDNSALAIIDDISMAVIYKNGKWLVMTLTDEQFFQSPLMTKEKLDKIRKQEKKIQDWLSNL